MELIESKNCRIFKDFFSPSIIAGFTTKAIDGDLPESIEKIPILKNNNLQLAYLKQIHSDNIHFVKEKSLNEGDGLFTDTNNLALVVRTADCLPLFLSSDKENVIGIIHMGWRGAAGGILDNISYDLSSFKVACGVGLRHCCYEVGEEFLYYPNFKDYIDKRDVKLYFNPISFVRDVLIKKGLKPQNFYDSDICSLCSRDFFSYRRDKTDLRTLSFIFKK